MSQRSSSILLAPKCQATCLPTPTGLASMETVFLSVSFFRYSRWTMTGSRLGIPALFDLGRVDVIAPPELSQPSFSRSFLA